MQNDIEKQRPNEMYVRRTLDKFFGKDHKNFEYAVIEILNIFDHPLNDIPDPKKGFQPAYLNATEDNLINGCCRFCEMAWYNCLCSHEE